MDRLTAEDIERSRSELAELELKFLERVAQTNRCKNSGGVGSKHGKKPCFIVGIIKINRDPHPTSRSISFKNITEMTAHKNWE